MDIATVLLISKDDSLKKTAEGVVGSFDNLRLDVRSEFVDLQARADDIRPALVLIHSCPKNRGGVREAVERLRVDRWPVATVIVSDEMNAEEALALFRLGVIDYLIRPLDVSRLTYLIDVLTARSRMASGRAPADLKPIPEARVVGPSGFCAVSPLMEQLMGQVHKVAPQDTTILLTGETGTGKTCLARVIHQLSPRSDEPFLVIDCGALSGNLIESEMFGHVRGAFTGANRDYSGKFAAVGRGTLLLDEIDALPFTLQTKLLRAVDERVFEAVGSTKPQKLQARLIVATNRSLEHEVANGRFRSDLYYRLNVIGFYLPPLRERTGAIAQFARGFLNEFAGRHAGGMRSIAPQAMRALEQYGWPGNVRELRNCIERAVALCGGPEIVPSDLPDNVMRSGSFTATLAPSTNGHANGHAANGHAANLNLAEIKEEAELARLIHALQKHGRSRKQVAQELGISRTALYNKLNKYGLGKQNRLALDEAPNGQDCIPVGAIPVGAGLCGATRATFTS